MSVSLLKALDFSNNCPPPCPSPASEGGKFFFRATQERQNSPNRQFLPPHVIARFGMANNHIGIFSVALIADTAPLHILYRKRYHETNDSGCRFAQPFCRRLCTRRFQPALRQSSTRRRLYRAAAVKLPHNQYFIYEIISEHINMITFILSVLSTLSAPSAF